MKTHLITLLALLFPFIAFAAQTDIVGPAGSGTFGTSLTVLPNGNFVVTDPTFNGGIGAAYLYSATGTLISTLTGSGTGDQVGNGGVSLLSNGNFVVRSQNWDSTTPAAANAGATTWGSATTGFIGGATVVVAATNSIVGSTTNDFVGQSVTPLTNGNYLVRSTSWNNTGASGAGAVTWGNGSTGTVGVVSEANSLVGSTANDSVGETGITVLNNGNYVVTTRFWNNTATATADVGAVTWGNGATGTSGAVSAANSLIGSTANDLVGQNGVTVLTNNNYVVISQVWDSVTPAVVNVGAATWGNGSTGISGPISAANSLIGSTAEDRVGSTVIALTNGNYVVSSNAWSSTTPALASAGAVTWGNGSTGISGPVSAANSLVGSTVSESVGNGGVTALTNGNYVVNTPNWDQTAPATTNVGASTWCDGSVGRIGVVDATNSLIGSADNDQVGRDGAKALTNGNYVVRSTLWDNAAPAATNAGAVTWCVGTAVTTGTVSAANSLVGQTNSDAVGNSSVLALTNGNYVVFGRLVDNTAPAIVDAGAVTWGNGSTGTSGIVSAANSLMGSTLSDQIGNGNAVALTNGNYVVISHLWDNTAPATADVGAVTWVNGSTGLPVGSLSAANSLIGSTALDKVGENGVTALTNGNFVVRSSSWDNTAPAAANAGAVTWGNGSTGLPVGAVSTANSLVGTTATDQIGAVTALSDGNYSVSNLNWDNTAPVTANSGAVTLGNGATGTTGLITALNSLLGTAANGGPLLKDGYDASRGQVVIGRPSDNTVSIFGISGTLALSASSATVDEGAGTVTVTILRTVGTSGAVSVNLSTSSAGGTATANSDYTSITNQVVSFANGETSKQVLVTITDDIVANEPDETFSVTLSSPTSGASLGSPSTAIITIIENDLLPGTLALSAASYITDEEADTLNVTINRSLGAAGAINVLFTSAIGTATAADYTPINQIVAFANGESSKQVAIGITNDTLKENDETFTVTLSSPTNGALLGAITTATVRILDNDPVDATAPAAPTITAPLASARVGLNLAATTTLTGKAADNKGATLVEVSLNGAAFTPATITSAAGAYTLTLTPLTGPNTVQVRSSDGRGNLSPITTGSFVVTRPLLVSTTGAGSVTAGFVPTSFREVGKLTTIKATPAVGSLFVNWTITGATAAQIGVNAALLEQPTLNFIFRTGLQLTANFAANPYLTATTIGTFNGLITPSTTLPDRAPLGAGPEDGTQASNSTRGGITLKVTNTGAFSGSASIDGLTLPIVGVFDATGAARFGATRLLSLSIPRVSKNSLSLTLQIDVTPPINAGITGTLAEADGSGLLAFSTIQADRAISLPPAQLIGSFNVALPFVASQPGDYPQGDGIANLSVSKTGIISGSVTLADGTVFTAAGTLSAANVWQLFASLYGKAGNLAGSVQFDHTQPTTDLTATLAWHRPILDDQHFPAGWPDGIAVGMKGSKHAAIPGTSIATQLTTTDNADLIFTDGLLAATQTKVVSITNADIATNLPVSAAYKLTISRANGRLAGFFTHSNGTKPTFQGIVLHKGASLTTSGFFKTETPKVKDYTGQSGRMTLVP